MKGGQSKSKREKIIITVAPVSHSGRLLSFVGSPLRYTDDLVEMLDTAEIEKLLSQEIAICKKQDLIFK